MGSEMCIRDRSIPGNLVQGVFGIAAGVAVYAVLDRSHVLARA